MKRMIRPVALSVAFAAILASGVAALTLRGETKEAGLVEDACARAAWPLIPAKCLAGGRGFDVRVVADLATAREVPESSAIEARFNSDFQ